MCKALAIGANLIGYNIDIFADTIFVVEGEIDAMSIRQAFKGKIGVVAVPGAAA